CAPDSPSPSAIPWEQVDPVERRFHFGREALPSARACAGPCRDGNLERLPRETATTASDAADRIDRFLDAAGDFFLDAFKRRARVVALVSGLSAPVRVARTRGPPALRSEVARRQLDEGFRRTAATPLRLRART